MFAAHLLRAIGWRVDVFERSAEDLAGRGAGLGSHEALVAILKRIGIDFSRAARRRDPALCLARRGRAAWSRDVPRPRMMTAWSRLYRPLKDLLPRELYHAAKSLVRVEQDAASVTAIFADGTRETGDLLDRRGRLALRGARAILAPARSRNMPATSLGARCGAEADATEAQRELLYSRNAFCIPDGELWVSYPVPARDGDVTPGKRDYNIVWYRPADEATLADYEHRRAGQAARTDPAAADPARRDRRREGRRRATGSRPRSRTCSSRRRARPSRRSTISPRRSSCSAAR